MAHNAIDLVLHMRNVHQGQETTDRAAVTWLAETFGRDRAIATVVHTEQHAGALIRAHERSRESERAPQRGLQQEMVPIREQQHERGGFTR
jgi:hypothetical protein